MTLKLTNRKPTAPKAVAPDLINVIPDMIRDGA